MACLPLLLPQYRPGFDALPRSSPRRRMRPVVDARQAARALVQDGAPGVNHHIGGGAPVTHRQAGEPAHLGGRGVAVVHNGRLTG